MKHLVNALISVSDKTGIVEFAAALQALGGIDILVNNAGVYKAARLVDTTAEDFDRIMQVNVYGVFHVLQRVLRHMQERGRGKVINIASTAGKWGSMNQSAYNASKHAVVGLTRCAALEMGVHGINVNAICPGRVLTPLVQKQIDDLAAREKIDNDAATRLLLGEKQPALQFVTLEQLGGVAVFLCSEAAANIRDVSVSVDGGWVA